MKKAICAALIFALLVSLAACDGEKKEQSPGAEPEISVEAPVLGGTAPETEKEPTAEETQPEESNTEGAAQEVTEVKMKIQVGESTFTATLAENSSVKALKELMAEGPLTLNMSDYASMEKGADLGTELPQNNEQMNTVAGDIILYQGRTLVIYYDTNSWSLTPIGKIDNVDAESLKAALGTGDVTVTFSLE